MSSTSNSFLPESSQDNTSQLLNDIQSLQDIEQQLFTSLEENQNLTPDQQKEIVQKINDISTMRINLYKTLNNLNNYFQNTLSISQGTLSEQVSTISIVENELNQNKEKLKLLQQEKSNKIRLIEINNYFGEKYAEHGNLMKIIIAILLPTLILAILNQKGILPNTVYYILLSLIAIVGFYFLWMRIISIWRRDNMNYQEYDWAFDPSNVRISKGSTRDPWTVSTKASVAANADCVGDACCSTGLTWDASRNQCIIGGASSPSSIATNAAPVSTNNNNNNRNNNNNTRNVGAGGANQYTESFVNNVLSQPAYAFKKPDVVLGGNYVQPSSGTTSSLYSPF
jgi:uncharacterized membrane protein YqaE (UPF0057 family)